MTKTNTLAAKLSVAFVAAAMVFTMIVPATQAQTVEELQAQITALMAQINQLTADAGAGDGAVSSSSVCPYTWTRTLNTGATGADVMKLQQFLNSSADTQVATTGNPGGPGSETSYYGPATGAAVAKFQAKHRMDILSPLGLVNPTTFFGNSTMAKANALCVNAPTTTPDTGSDDEDATEDDDDDTSGSTQELSGNAFIRTYEVDDVADDDIEEGGVDQPIAELDIEFDDGDALVTRLELNFDHISGLEDDTYDTFETISLWLDGDMIAEVNADSRRDWRDGPLGDDDQILISGLDFFAEEGVEYNFIIAATIQDGIDFNGSNPNVWEVSAEDMRYEDGTGFVQEENNSSGKARFNIEEEGTDDEVDVRSSSKDPVSQTIILEDDDDVNEIAFAFELDTDDSKNDIEIESLQIDAAIVNASGSASDLTDLVDDVRILVDGNFVSDDTVTVNAGNIVVTFDDEDFMIDAGDRVTVEVEFEFKALATIDEGTLITFSIDGTNIDAEGAKDLTGTGSATGEEHTLLTEGFEMDLVSVKATTRSINNGTEDVADFEVVFTLKAVDRQFYVSETAATAIAANIVSAGGTSTAATGGTLISNATKQSGSFLVNEGQSKEFTYKVSGFNPTVLDDYRLKLDTLTFGISTSATGKTQTFIPTEDFETGFTNIAQQQ